MTWDNLAPWIAIAFTLALSILVPLFTQIANNVHQRKLQQEKIKHEESHQVIETYRDFLSEVGGLITAHGHVEKEHLLKAGAALHKLYIYAPSEWHADLDQLMELIMEFKWREAKPLIHKFSRLISKELKLIDNKR